VITTTATGINATASIKINRQKFGIRYASNFFKKIADNAINNEFELNISLVAGK
jgi:polyisoprenoid-binding protein YceI